MRALSLFSGAGGMDYGFAAAGIHSILGCEMDKNAAASFRKNFLNTRIYNGDVRNLLTELNRGMVDIVFGGPPCQGYSVAGKMNPSDPRSALVHAFMDAVDITSPSAFVMENVDALARLEKWSGTLKDIRDKAAQSGYSTHVEILDAADFGVPQSRKRMFIWGSKHLGEDQLAVTVLQALNLKRTERKDSNSVFQRLGRAGTSENPLTSKAIITYCKKPILRASPYAGMLFNGAGRPIDPLKPAPTISASAGGNKTHIVDEAQVFDGQPAFVEAYRRRLDKEGAFEGLAPSRLRRLTIAESRAFQTLPDDFELEGSMSSIYRQIGNAVPSQLACAVASAAVYLTEFKRVAA